MYTELGDVMHFSAGLFDFFELAKKSIRAFFEKSKRKYSYKTSKEFLKCGDNEFEKKKKRRSSESPTTINHAGIDKMTKSHKFSFGEKCFK